MENAGWALTLKDPVCLQQVVDRVQRGADEKAEPFPRPVPPGPDASADRLLLIVLHQPGEGFDGRGIEGRPAAESLHQAPRFGMHGREVTKGRCSMTRNSAQRCLKLQTERHERGPRQGEDGVRERTRFRGKMAPYGCQAGAGQGATFYLAPEDRRVLDRAHEGQRGKTGRSQGFS